MFRWNFLRDIGNKVKESLLFAYAFEQKKPFLCNDLRRIEQIDSDKENDRTSTFNQNKFKY